MKSRNKYPWGVENPIERERRLKSQIAREAEGSAKRLRWEKEMAALENWRAENPDGQRTAPAEPEATDKRWVPHLRERWCAACNAVLEKEEHPKRYHPGGYKDLGIDAEPTKHLGNKASALEAQGHITAAGPANTETALRNMMADSEARNGGTPPVMVHAAERRKTWAEEEARRASDAGRAVRLDYWKGQAADAAGSLERMLAERARENLPMIGAAIRIDKETARSALRARPALPPPEAMDDRHRHGP